MSFSRKTSFLSKPEKGKAINSKHMSFVKTRCRNKAQSLLLEAFSESRMTKAELAKMLGKRPEQITRLFSGPANITLDTLSAVIFATSGQMLALSKEDILSEPRRNFCGPDWAREAEVHRIDPATVTITFPKSTDSQGKYELSY